MAKSNKDQHWVPKSYLAAWCDPDTPAKMEPYVWIFPREGGEGRNKAPANIFTENEMYTIPLPDGGRDLRVEHGLSQLEKGLKQLREEFIDRRRQIPGPRFVKFIAFIAAMHGRSRSFRDHQREQWQRILDVGEDMQRSIEKKTPEERKRIAGLSLRGDGPSMTMDEVQRVVDMPVQMMMPAVLNAQVPVLSQMVMTIYCTDDQPGFITSDSPVVWFDPESYKRPPMLRGPALMYESIEITMPISPRHLVAIHHDDPMSRGIKPIKYIDAWPETVKRMNMRTAFYAEQTVVVSRNIFRPEWHFWQDAPAEGDDN